jgi:hypothetical protein
MRLASARARGVRRSLIDERGARPELRRRRSSARISSVRCSREARRVIVAARRRRARRPPVPGHCVARRLVCNAFSRPYASFLDHCASASGFEITRKLPDELACCAC